MKPTVLVLDDDPLSASVMAELLWDAGYEPRIAHRGAEALAILQGGEPPAAAVVDQNLPDIDGASLIRGIRREPRLAEVRVLAVSGDAAARREAAQLGVPVLAKPFSVVEFLDAIHALGRVDPATGQAEPGARRAIRPWSGRGAK